MSTSPSLNPEKLRKAVVVIDRIRTGERNKISFFPDSSYTTEYTIRQMICSAFNLPESSRFFLEDPEDGALVPIDKSLSFSNTINLIDDTDDITPETFKYSHLLEVCSCISAESQPEKAIHTIVENAKEVLEADRVVLYILDPDTRVLVIASTSKYKIQQPSTADEGEHSDHEDKQISVAQEVVHTNSPIYQPYILCTIVRESGGEILGVIEVSRLISQLKPFKDDSIHALEFISSCLGSVLHRLQLRYHSHRAEDRAQALLKVTKTLAAAKTPEEIVKLIVKEAYELLHAERVAVFLVHAQEKELEICLSKDASGTRIPITQGVAGYVARTGESVNVQDARKDERFDSNTDSLTGFRTISVLCCPILDSSCRVIGVIQALNKITKTSNRKGEEKAVVSEQKVESFTNDDCELLEMLTQSAGVTLQNAQLLQTAERAKITSRALLRLVQQIVGEADFLKLDRLLRSCCTQLLDCDKTVLAWVSRTDSTLRIFVDHEQETLKINLSDMNAFEVKVYKESKLLNIAHLDQEPELKSKFDAHTEYKTYNALCAPIGGGIQGPIAVIIALNKLEPESTLVRGASGGSLQQVSRAIKLFSKEDETDLALFCSEVEGALRVKRNLQLDFTNLLFDETERESLKSGGEKTDQQGTQQRRLIALYSGRDQIFSNKITERKSSSSLNEDWTDDEGESPSKERGLEEEAKEIVNFTLSDSLNVNELAQPMDVLKKWALSLFFSDMTLLKQNGVDIKKFPKFIAEVSENYLANPFHNFYHAFSVLHTAFDICTRTAEGKRMDSITNLSVLLAALCHDLGHKGMTNSYESATLSELAIRYSDEAILEHYHAYVAFRLLYQEERCNILATMAPQNMSILRKYIIEGILATDMRRHVEHVAELERVVVERRRSFLFRGSSFSGDDFLKTPTTRSRRTSLDSPPNTSPPPISSPGTWAASLASGHRRRNSSLTTGTAFFAEDVVKPVKPISPKPVESFFSTPEGKSLYVRSVVHASDLSSQTLKTEYAEDWGRRITAEFTAQAELERSLGLSVSVPVCKTEVEFFKSQVFFIRQIVMPLWRGLSELIPELHVRVVSLEANAEYYETAASKVVETSKSSSSEEEEDNKDLKKNRESETSRKRSGPFSDNANEGFTKKSGPT